MKTEIQVYYKIAPMSCAAQQFLRAHRDVVLGVYFGYRWCCISAYSARRKKRLPLPSDRFRYWKGTGFVPCKACALALENLYDWQGASLFNRRNLGSFNENTCRTALDRHMETLAALSYWESTHPFWKRVFNKELAGGLRAFPR